jgi:hypothetical protein
LTIGELLDVNPNSYWLPEQLKVKGDNMISSPTPDILQNLKAVLTKIMKPGHIRNKYTSALDDAIREIVNEEVHLITAAFAVSVKGKENNGIIIDIFSAEGPLIDTIEYDSDDILTTDGEAGEA